MFILSYRSNGLTTHEIYTSERQQTMRSNYLVESRQVKQFQRVNANTLTRVPDGSGIMYESTKGIVVTESNAVIM